MSNNIFHIFNRGVKKSVVFRKQGDYLRFIYTIYKTNNKEGALRGSYKKPLSKWPSQQDKLVEVLKWSLLPNHFHMLVAEVAENGALEFVSRLGNSYTKYSNIKYEESGHVFQNKTQRVAVINEPQFLYIPYYIELNPLDLLYPSWKNSGSNNMEVEKAESFLKNYRWSSFRNYLGKGDEFEEVINKDLFYEFYDTNSQEYEKEIKEWIQEIPNLETFS